MLFSCERKEEEKKAITIAPLATLLSISTATVRQARIGFAKEKGGVRERERERKRKREREREFAKEESE
jgi:hypothetical protein